MSESEKTVVGTPYVEEKGLSSKTLILMGVAAALALSALALRFLAKPCPCNEQLGEADASAEAVAVASAIVERGRTVTEEVLGPIVEGLPSFDVPKVAVPGAALATDAPGALADFRDGLDNKLSAEVLPVAPPLNVQVTSHNEPVTKTPANRIPPQPKPRPPRKPRAK